MNQVLILTKNLLVEEQIQTKLQKMHYEVYCSVKVFENYDRWPEMLEFLKFFQYIILSETICQSEVVEILDQLKDHSIPIIRKVEAKLTEMDYKYLEQDRIHAIISNEDSVDELRECLSVLKNRRGTTDPDYNIQLSEKVSMIRSQDKVLETFVSSADKTKFTDVLHQLSSTEAKILSVLIQAGSEVVTREELCHQIWNEEVNTSHLASLSSTVTRIKGKFEKTDLSHKAIHTLWGKGYRINPELLSRIIKSESFTSLIAKEG